MRVGIIGTGLIGGSMALALRKNKLCSQIIGVERNKELAQEAIDLGLVDKAMPLMECLDNVDLIILAIPVNSIVELLPKVLDGISKDQIVVDLGSTKESIVNAVADHPHRSRYVACHPMAGTEFSGPSAAVEGLYQDRTMVICDAEDSDNDALAFVEQISIDIGMVLCYHDAHDHDMHTAYVSHISHISSMALALTVLEKERDEKRIFELAAGGFESTVRLAKSNADTWIPIFKQNRDNVLDVLDEHINTISRFRTLLIKEDFNAFHDLILKANNIQKILNKKL